MKKENDGFIKCNKCKGSGCMEGIFVYFNCNTKKEARLMTDCDKCRGRGKLTWLENIFNE